ncbi:transcription initiation factor TFIID subunit 4-like [Hippocampus zosterae]|uniref:transcription initiation factor TFIID subunit 4-like n=1 Tax=Hippocampus zosterae TaxID=109293 RepID=UPI00223D3C93|nr:transcription initiation factor TFIID subunit 4-like [Hippocampus zosterae]
MAGASDPLEDMLFNEVDEKAVSDLVGSLESQLGEAEGPAASYSAGKREGAQAVATHFSGKVREQEPQQGHPGAALKLQPPAAQLLPSYSSTSSGGSAAPVGGGAGPETFGPAASSSPVRAPAVQTLSAQPAAAVSFQRAAETSGRTASPGLQSLNGTAGAVKLLGSAASTTTTTTTTTTTGATAAAATTTMVVTSATANSPLSVMAAPVNFLPGTQSAAPPAPQHRLPSAAQNGVESKGGSVVPPGAPSPSQVVNHSKILVPGQPTSGNSVILTSTPPPPATACSPVAQPLVPPAVKPAVNGLGQAAVRPAGAVHLQRAGTPTGTVRPAAPHPLLAVRPQQQATIQLPPGFTMPAGMVLVRIETGQLVMVPQQVLAQAQAKTQQSPGLTAVPQRPAGPTAPAAIRVSTAAPTPVSPQNIRLATPPHTRLQSPASSSSPSSSSSVQAITVTSGTAGVSVKMAPPPKAQPSSAAEVTTATPTAAAAAAVVKPLAAAAPGTAAAPGGSRVTLVSQEMQENVKKCKNFLATLIKLASNNSPSPDTSKNVKGLVQDLLDAKIEPEEFTSRLQAELKSSPQPYLIPFLKKSLPALRQSLLSSQQSLTTPPTSSYAPPMNAAIRPRLPVGTPGVRMNAPLATATVAMGRGTMQTVRAPLVVGVRTPGALMRGPAAMVAKSVVTLAAPANQKKLGDPGGGTFRDDDDINDVASMAGVNLSEENARILATSSELVGTKIRSCKDEAFLPAGLLHRRILDTARRLGVSEVPLEVVNLVSHATQSRLRSLLEKVTALAQHRSDAVKDEEHHEQTSDVRSQLRFFEQLERLEKQRKDEQEREILLKAAKSRARQEDPEQARLKQKAKEMQQQELAQMRQRDANLTALAAIGPRKKRKMDSPGGGGAAAEVSSGSSAAAASASSLSSPRQPWRQRITRVNLRDLIVCLEQDGSTARSLMLYKALLK